MRLNKNLPEDDINRIESPDTSDQVDELYEETDKVSDIDSDFFLEPSPKVKCKSILKKPKSYQHQPTKSKVPKIADYNVKKYHESFEKIKVLKLSYES